MNEAPPSPGGRSVLISGGSSGIGLECAALFHAAGDRVHLAARREDRLLEARRQIPERRSGTAGVPSTHLCDVADSAQVKLLVRAVIQEEGRLDVLVNSAGLFHVSELLEESEARALEALRVNLLGPFLLLREAAGPAVEADRELHVVNVLSVAALKPFAGCGLYTAGKAGLKGLMDVAREELRGRGIRITNVFPGATATPLWAEGGHDPETMMDPAEVARQIFACCESGKRTLVEELVLRPPGGDL